MANYTEYFIGDETSTSSESSQLVEIQSQVVRKESSPQITDLSTESLPSTSMSLKKCNNSLDTPSTSGKSEICAKIVLECPICLQSCIHPAQLPCGHVFCFLCIKGVAYKNRRCAMCRQEIPSEFLDHPQLVNGLKDIVATKTTEDGYQWYYEGRNGWWQYDDRTSQDIEDAYKNGDKSCTILVAGYVYIVDLDALLQQRQNEPTRCRKVKRDLATITKKGVAGLRINDDTILIEAQISSNNSRTLSNYNSQLDIDDINEHPFEILSAQSSLHIPSNTIDSTAVIQTNEDSPVRATNALLDVTNADSVSFSNDILILHPNNEISNIGDTLLNTNGHAILNTDFQSMLNVTLNDLNMLSISNNILYLGTVNNHDINTNDEERNDQSHF